MRRVRWPRDAVPTSWQTSREQLAGWLAARLSWLLGCMSCAQGASLICMSCAYSHSSRKLMASWLITQLGLVCRVWLAGGLVL